MEPTMRFKTWPRHVWPSQLLTSPIHHQYRSIATTAHHKHLEHLIGTRLPQPPCASPRPLQSIMVKSNKCLAQNVTHMVMVGSAADLSGLSPTQLNALTGRSAGGGGPAAGIQKKKKKEEAKSVSILSIYSFFLIVTHCQIGSGKVEVRPSPAREEGR